MAIKENLVSGKLANESRYIFLSDDMCPMGSSVTLNFSIGEPPLQVNFCLIILINSYSKAIELNPENIF